MQALCQTRLKHGADTYPGSPAVAAQLLRSEDKLHLAELHPGEFGKLKRAIGGGRARCRHQDGFELAHALCPPQPRRGLLLIDPSYEIKSDYNRIPTHLARIAKAWNVGILFLWYPILNDLRHRPMLDQLEAQHEKSLRHEVFFKPAQKSHGMIGSGVFLCNPPFGMEDAAKEISDVFEKASITSS
ncbi:MAG: 23S rRNA (adenine(2030)-N(6))-methyltransferase RlmJ [Roseobacter sp.]|nr:23S rRNA (adenine(2030)-N(6))-methyltransferase RlmJ [Roseobacter sp.]